MLDLLKLQKEQKVDELAQYHTRNLEDLEELKDDLCYYLKLHREAFTGPDGPDLATELATPLEPIEKLTIAYQFMDEAKLRGK